MRSGRGLRGPAALVFSGCLLSVAALGADVSPTPLHDEFRGLDDIPAFTRFVRTAFPLPDRRTLDSVLKGALPAIRKKAPGKPDLNNDPAIRYGHITRPGETSTVTISGTFPRQSPAIRAVLRDNFGRVESAALNSEGNFSFVGVPRGLDYSLTVYDGRGRIDYLPCESSLPEFLRVLLEYGARYVPWSLWDRVERRLLTRFTPSCRLRHVADGDRSFANFHRLALSAPPALVDNPAPVAGCQRVYFEPSVEVLGQLHRDWRELLARELSLRVGTCLKILPANDTADDRSTADAIAIVHSDATDVPARAVVLRSVVARVPASGTPAPLRELSGLPGLGNSQEAISFALNCTVQDRNCATFNDDRRLRQAPFRLVMELADALSPALIRLGLHGATVPVEQDVIPSMPGAEVEQIVAGHYNLRTQAYLLERLSRLPPSLRKAYLEPLVAVYRADFVAFFDAIAAVEGRVSLFDPVQVEAYPFDRNVLIRYDVHPKDILGALVVAALHSEQNVAAHFLLMTTQSTLATISRDYFRLLLEFGDDNVEFGFHGAPVAAEIRARIEQANPPSLFARSISREDTLAAVGLLTDTPADTTAIAELDRIHSAAASRFIDDIALHHRLYGAPRTMSVHGTPQNVALADFVRSHAASAGENDRVLHRVERLIATNFASAARLGESGVAIELTRAAAADGTPRCLFIGEQASHTLLIRLAYLLPSGIGPIAINIHPNSLLRGIFDYRVFQVPAGLDAARVDEVTRYFALRLLERAADLQATHGDAVSLDLANRLRRVVLDTLPAQTNSSSAPKIPR